MAKQIEQAQGTYYFAPVPPMDAELLYRVEDHNRDDAELTAAERQLLSDWETTCQSHYAKFCGVVEAARADAAKLLDRKQTIRQRRQQMGTRLHQLLRDADPAYKQNILNEEAMVKKSREEAAARLRKLGITQDCCPAASSPWAPAGAIEFQWQQRLDREPEVELALCAWHRAQCAGDVLTSRQSIDAAVYGGRFRLPNLADATFMAMITNQKE